MKVYILLEVGPIKEWVRKKGDGDKRFFVHQLCWGTRPSDLYGKFTWKIENFSQISKRELRSNMFEVGGYKWYILVYPQGCDVCNHLSLFLCVADYDKLLPGWSHFVQFTIAVVNKDPKKSKYSDTLHRFCKKEHDWGWKKFMELSKVLDGFTVADTLVIKAQVQVIRENPHRPFRCLDCQYRRELVRVYMTNVEGICRRFVEEKREKIGKLMGDPLRWPRIKNAGAQVPSLYATHFRAFWAALEENVRRRLSREKTDIILKAIVKAFFNEKEVTSTLVMDALYSGCKALDYRSKNKKGKINGVEIEEARNPVVWIDKDFFVLAGDVLSLLDRAAHESLPSYKDEKGPQNRTKDGGPGDDFGKDTMERDERRLTELGRRTVEMFVLAHLFSNRVEVEYLEAIALKRQEELIREEEAAGQAEIELKARREAAEKEKRNKKKQAKQRRNIRKEKEKDGEEKQSVAGGQSRLGEGSTSSRASLSSSKEASIRTGDIVDDDDDSSVLDNTDGIVGTLRAALEDGDADRTFWEREGSDFHPTTEASFSGGSCIDSAQNGRSNRKQQSLLDDSSSTCSSDSIPSNNTTLDGFGRRRSNTADQLPNSVNRVRGRIGSDKELRASDNKGVLRVRAGSGSSEASVLGGVDADTVIASLKQRVQWLQQRLHEKEEEVVLLHQQLSLYQHHYGCDVLKEDDPKIAKVSDWTPSRVGSDSVPLSPSRESGESLKNGGGSLDDFQHVRGGSSDPAASLANGSCSETLLGSHSGVQSIPVANLSKGSATSPSLCAVGSSHLASLPSATYDNIAFHGGPDNVTSTSQSALASSLTIESGMVRPSSAPSPPEAPRQSPPFQQQSHPPPTLARTVSATGRLGVTSSESASSCTQPVYPVAPSYRNAAAGVIRSNQTGGMITFSEANLRSQTSYPHASGSETYRASPTLSGMGDPSALAGSIYQRNLLVSGQAVASKAKSEPLIQGYGKASPGSEPEKFGGVESRSNQEAEHRHSGVGLTFGTVTPEVLHLQHPQQRHTESSEGSTLESNIMSREAERYREHQYNGRCSDNEFAQQQNHAGHSASLTQKGVAHRVAGPLGGGPQAQQRGLEMPGLASGMSEDFPHLDIINELLDEDRLLGAKALNAFLQQPVALHELQRMYDGRVCVNMNSLHGSAERSDNVLPPHDNGGVPHYANSAESILSGLGEGMQLHPYAHSSLQRSLGLPGGLVDAMPGHHWQGRSNDTSTVTGSNGMQVGLDMLMGYPMPSPHLAMADCPPFTLGQNGYPMYSPIKHP
ncbi:hypothetical protein GOP47_0000759 [Adiantum capillus-veneris]|uniref:MATH domain-containing protein n=1 Tax=Adiantum capillus-veneris TaxID=13818 RepID=A0A9D4VEJ7_ADICA|nr:hypothetical protein GOP47_0000759 [Adiantum capillus-veneris]